MNHPRRLDPQDSGGYEVPGVVLNGVLGRGGFATVYAGEQTSLGRQVAVKIDSRPLDSERNRRRFLREMSAASRISGHPHVVTLIDAGVLPDGRPYLVMERCDGGSLASITPSNALAPADAAKVVEAVSAALGAAHAAGVLHRDIKPGNILLDSYGSPRLSDFGIAAIQREEQDSSVTLEAMTPAFAPPEAFNLEPPTAAGDVWSMGGVLLSLITGRGPRTTLEGRAQNLSEIYQGLGQPINTDDPRVPAVLKPVLAKAMHPQASQRYQDGNELAAGLRDVIPLLGPTQILSGSPNWPQPETPTGSQPGVAAGPQPGVVTGPQPGAATGSQPGAATGPQPGVQTGPQSDFVQAPVLPSSAPTAISATTMPTIPPVYPHLTMGSGVPAPVTAATQVVAPNAYPTPGPPAAYSGMGPAGSFQGPQPQQPKRNRTPLWALVAGFALGALVLVALVWGVPALTKKTDTAVASATPQPTADATTQPTTAPSTQPTPSAATEPTTTAPSPTQAPSTTAAPVERETPSMVNENGIPYSPKMPWALGTCMTGTVDDQGISSAMEVSCEVGNWQVFAGGELSPNNPGKDAGEALALDTQIPVVCTEKYAKLYGIDTSVNHEIRVLGPLDAEWEAGKRGFSCVFVKL